MTSLVDSDGEVKERKAWSGKCMNFLGNFPHNVVLQCTFNDEWLCIIFHVLFIISGHHALLASTLPPTLPLILTGTTTSTSCQLFFLAWHYFLIKEISGIKLLIGSLVMFAVSIVVSLILWMVERWLSWNITTSWSQKQPFKRGISFILEIYIFLLFLFVYFLHCLIYMAILCCKYVIIKLWSKWKKKEQKKRGDYYWNYLAISNCKLC